MPDDTAPAPTTAKAPTAKATTATTEPNAASATAAPTGNDDGFSAKSPTTAEMNKADDDKSPNRNAVEVESNHNSLSPATPLPLEILRGKPDYNPMRSVPNKANDKSDVTMVPDSAADLIDAKGDRPTAAMVEVDGGPDQMGKDLPGVDVKRTERMTEVR